MVCSFFVQAGEGATAAFFVVIGLAAVVAALACHWLEEPADAFSDRLVAEHEVAGAAAVVAAPATADTR